MISLELDHLFRLKGHRGLAKRDVFLRESSVSRLIHLIESRDQGFLDLVSDEHGIDSILAYARRVRGKFRHVVVLGIGGSALGASALLQALRPLHWNEFSARVRGGPTLHVVDNVDPELLASLEKVLDYPETLFVVITKSGTTPETMAQYFYFRKKMKKLFGRRASEHFVFVTNSMKGGLRKIAEEESIACFPIPENVGGRFSVLSAVGLLPAALVGIDIRALVRGATTMVRHFFDSRARHNPAYLLAHVQYLLQQQRGVSITVMMPYSCALSGIADWYRQLLAESIGKSHTRDGHAVHVGLTPVSALGVTDQHSQIQLYNEGPFDKFVLFIETKKFRSDVPISVLKHSDGFDFLRGVSFSNLMHTEKMATQEALQRYYRPSGSIVLDRIDEEHVGQLIMMLECSVAMLGEMYHVNAFDQPGVELAKELTKKMLRR